MGSWKQVADLVVYGVPKAQPRPRSFAVKGKARMYNPATAEGWKQRIGTAALTQRPGTPLQGPLRVSIDFYLPRPKRLCRKKDPNGPIRHTAKPDRDNLEKAVLDALTAIGFWGDDCQVCAGQVRKFYHGKDAQPGARIRIEVLTDATT